MQVADHHERVETDRVSSFLQALAIAMMVLGLLFGALDESGLLPQPAATAAHEPVPAG
jgi:hypothetical protein